MFKNICFLFDVYTVLPPFLVPYTYNTLLLKNYESVFHFVLIRERGTDRMSNLRWQFLIIVESKLNVRRRKKISGFRTLQKMYVFVWVTNEIGRSFVTRKVFLWNSEPIFLDKASLLAQKVTHLSAFLFEVTRSITVIHCTAGPATPLVRVHLPGKEDPSAVSEITVHEGFYQTDDGTPGM